MVAFVTARVWDDTHLILKTLALYHNTSMIALVDHLARQEADRVGIPVVPRDDSPVDLLTMPPFRRESRKQPNPIR